MASNRGSQTVMVELAWLPQRYQAGSAQVRWFHKRGGNSSPCGGLQARACCRRCGHEALWFGKPDGEI